MEATRDNQSRYGVPVLRERKGHENVEELFFSRRERQFMGGLLSKTGYNGRYVLFRPSRSFVRVLGDAVLRLNDALYNFRSQAADHLLLFEGDGLQAHYGELDRRVEAVRDRLVVLTTYCNRGFDGRLEEALQGLGYSEGEEQEGATPFEPLEEPREAQGPSVVGLEDGDAFEGVRQQYLDAGVLTESGCKEGWVALRPCPFYGRLMGEILCTLNDALMRVEGRMASDIMKGKEEVLRQYYRGLTKDLTALREDVEEIINFCGRKIL